MRSRSASPYPVRELVPRSKKDHRVETFLKRKADDLGSFSGGRGASVKKADRRPVSERAAGGNETATHQSSSEEDASAGRGGRTLRSQWSPPSDRWPSKR